MNTRDEMLTRVFLTSLIFIVLGRIQGQRDMNFIVQTKAIVDRLLLPPSFHVTGSEHA